MPNIGLPELVIMAVVYVVPAYLCGKVASSKGHEPVWLWVLLGLVFSWIALLIIAVLPPNRRIWES
jgi:multisubunit Na+/H+ antiporter MnhB subunit